MHCSPASTLRIASIERRRSCPDPLADAGVEHQRELRCRTARPQPVAMAADWEVQASVSFI